MSNDDTLRDFLPIGHLRICDKATHGLHYPCNRSCADRLYHVALALENTLAVEGPIPPVCEGHNEVQKRDGKPPWCSRCGWTHGQPARPARKMGLSSAERAATDPGHRPWTPEGGYA